ncbi:hypothetical protein [Methylobacterium nonmethylotrophicum]|uniref:Uncharacterized protein n=1 Tax=Methylobacterium nonmethylotrophicum TaxID=1141884 RepID=A0A4Z0NY49_9HYPH|nr:hypothetical protein [Methylobacterium nonmethylotrophicum]TGE02406.1 hypothetical protein EU555_01110 [Methylobacterium nonmethylotrophicum]
MPAWRGPARVMQGALRSRRELPMSDGVFDPCRRPILARRDAAGGGSLSVRRLREIETLLGVPINPAADQADDVTPTDAPIGYGLEDGLLVERQALALLRAFNRISDPDARRDVLRLVRAAARTGRA